MSPCNDYPRNRAVYARKMSQNFFWVIIEQFAIIIINSQQYCTVLSSREKVSRWIVKDYVLCCEWAIQRNCSAPITHETFSFQIKISLLIRYICLRVSMPHLQTDMRLQVTLITAPFRHSEAMLRVCIHTAIWHRICGYRYVDSISMCGCSKWHVV